MLQNRELFKAVFEEIVTNNNEENSRQRGF
jgi:hypothetical protein